MVRVLVVDDDAMFARVLEIQLMRHGVSVVVVANVSDALGAVHATSFDVVVTDYHLENGATGLDLVAAARARRPALPSS